MRVGIVKQHVALSRLVKPLALMLMAFYIGYHALHGERGLYALVREKRELSALNEELTQTKASREKLELRVSHMRNGSLDRDLLDEQMRRMMGVMKDGEIVVMNREAGRS